MGTGYLKREGLVYYLLLQEEEHGNLAKLLS
jgi:hypothetical protein